jgi:hypothetical protein
MIAPNPVLVESGLNPLSEISYERIGFEETAGDST